MVEVEIKAKLGEADSADIQKVIERLGKDGFTEDGVYLEEDIYFNAPDRDFMLTDEALRIRITEDAVKGEKSTFITYKGKKLDGISKTRNEYETSVGDEKTMADLLKALGYRFKRIVKKTRRQFVKGGISVCLDDVEDLGVYIELETMADTADGHTKIVERLLEQLDRLGVDRAGLTTKSYLELLLEKG